MPIPARISDATSAAPVPGGPQLHLTQYLTQYQTHALPNTSSKGNAGAGRVPREMVTRRMVTWRRRNLVARKAARGLAGKERQAHSKAGMTARRGKKRGKNDAVPAKGGARGSQGEPTQPSPAQVRPGQPGGRGSECSAIATLTKPSPTPRRATQHNFATQTLTRSHSACGCEQLAGIGCGTHSALALGPRRRRR